MEKRTDLYGFDTDLRGSSCWNLLEAAVGDLRGRSHPPHQGPRADAVVVDVAPVCRVRDAGFASSVPLAMAPSRGALLLEAGARHGRLVIPKFVKSIRTKVISPICVAFTHWYM
jgi:hypothetical protein